MPYSYYMYYYLYYNYEMIHKAFSLVPFYFYLSRNFLRCFLFESYSNSCCSASIIRLCCQLALWSLESRKTRKYTCICIYVRERDILILYLVENKTNTSYTLSINNSKPYTHINDTTREWNRNRNVNTKNHREKAPQKQ